MDKSSILRLAQHPYWVGRGSDEPVKPHDVNGSPGRFGELTCRRAHVEPSSRSPHRAGQTGALPRLALVWPLAAAVLALSSGCVKLNPHAELRVPANTARAAARAPAAPTTRLPVAAPTQPGAF
jgi:hypothetical protein